MLQALYYLFRVLVVKQNFSARHPARCISQGRNKVVVVLAVGSGLVTLPFRRNGFILAHTLPSAHPAAALQSAEPQQPVSYRRHRA